MKHVHWLLIILIGTAPLAEEVVIQADFMQAIQNKSLKYSGNVSIKSRQLNAQTDSLRIHRYYKAHRAAPAEKAAIITGKKEKKQPPGSTNQTTDYSLNIRTNTLNISFQDGKMKTLNATGFPTIMVMQTAPQRVSSRNKNNRTFRIHSETLRMGMLHGKMDTLQARGTPCIINIDTKKSKTEIISEKVQVVDNNILLVEGNVTMKLPNGSILTGESLKYNLETNAFQSYDGTSITIPKTASPARPNRTP